MRKINYTVLHCTASPQTQTVQSILNYWKRDLGWKQVGYHWLIKPDGEAVQLLDIEESSNGVAGFNANAIHISYIGGIATMNTKVNGVESLKGTAIDNRTAAQKKTQETLIRKYNIQFPEAVIQGHRDFSPDKNRNGVIEPNEWMKTCPSFSVKEWLRAIEFKSTLPFKLFETTAAVNIREGAGVKFKTVTGILGKGTQVKKLAEANGWVFCELYQTKIVGWIKKDFLT